MPLKIPKPIQTARLTVRPVDKSDLVALMKVNGDDSVTKYLPYSTWRTIADARAWLKRMRRHEKNGATVQFAVIDKASGDAVGTGLVFAFEESSRQAELGFALARKYWGAGYMTEGMAALIDSAFRTMGVRRFIAHADADNAASCALLARLGFTHEGTLRDRWLDGTRPRTAQVYGLLKREWPAKKPSGKKPRKRRSHGRSSPRSRRGA
ncbi:MAG TPA: GNAT family N-acetyltransferase [Usitatibacter sp.]|nr:GNAT family N-acetyltransferase [Usitatibacter sp.]